MQKPESDDPYFILQYIGFCRSKLGPKADILGVDKDSMLQYIKWQICKARNVLYNDPIWDRYTAEELMVEYFAIRFDEDEELSDSFETKLTQGNLEDDTAWMDRMANQFKTEQEAELLKNLPEDIEETFE